jgi:hypothetical protein
MIATRSLSNGFSGFNHRSSIVDSSPGAFRSIQVGSKRRTYSDWVGGVDLDDRFTFHLARSSSFNLRLERLKANADVAVISDQGEVLGVSARDGRRTESLHLNLAPGTYHIRVHATAGDTSYRLGVSAKTVHNSRTIAASANSEGDFSILNWNSILLTAIATDKTAPPLAARNMAIVNTAIYDAVNSILNFAKHYRVSGVQASIWASPEAAVTGAAYQTLVNLFPEQRGYFDAERAKALSNIPDGWSETEGFRVGTAVADAILAWRNNDGSAAVVNYSPPVGDGYWQPTPAAYAAALLPQWPQVTPFAMTSGSQFRAAPPPSYTSAQYATELAEVRSLGQNTSTTRTPEQTQIALMWADGSGSYTPPGHWLEIAGQVARSRNTSLIQQAQLFGLLGISLADAGISAWDTKYSYHQWRPIAAIRATSDPTWTPLLNTPPFPDYTSGHSTFSGAASAILSAFFGDNVAFTTSSMGLPGVYRSFNSFSEAANEAGRSRVFGGIHVESSNQAGLIAGREIGNYVLQNFAMS